MVGGGEDEQAGPNCEFETATLTYLCWEINSQELWDAFKFGQVSSSWAGNMWICDMWVGAEGPHNSEWDCLLACEQ